MNNYSNSIINQKLLGVEKPAKNKPPTLDFSLGSLIENNLLKAIDSLTDLIKTADEWGQNNEFKTRKNKLLIEVWELLREILDKKGRKCFAFNLIYFWSQFSFLTNFIEFFDCLIQFEDPYEEFNNAKLFESLEQQPLEDAMAYLISIAFSSIINLEVFDLNKFYLFLTKNIQSLGSAEKSQIYKSFTESKINQLIYNLNLIIYIRSVTLENKTEKEKEDLLLYHLDSLMQMKEDHDLYFFDELKGLAPMDFKTLLFAKMERAQLSMRFTILLQGSKNFIEFYDYLESHISNLTFLALFNFKTSDFIKCKMNKSNICDEFFGEIYINTFQLKEISLLLNLEELLQDGVNSASFFFNDYANSQACEKLLDCIFPDEKIQMILIRITEGVHYDITDANLFEYHNQLFLKLKFLNRYIFNSCSENLIKNSYPLNEKSNENTNKFKIPEDKFFFSFLLQVIYPNIERKAEKILALIKKEVALQKSNFKSFQLFEESEFLSNEMKNLIQTLIAFLRALILNTICYKCYIFWENKEYMQYFFSKIYDLFYLVAKVHPVFVLIFSDFIKKFYVLIIRRIDATNIFYKTLTQHRISQSNQNNKPNLNNIADSTYKKFNIDIRVIMVNYLESYLHFLIYTKRLYYSYVNLSLLKYFNFVYEIVFKKNEEEDLFFFSSKIHNIIFDKSNLHDNKDTDKKIRLECNITKIIFKFLLQMGCCLDIDKIDFYTFTDDSSKIKLKNQNFLLEKLQEDYNLTDISQIEALYRSLSIKPANIQSQINTIIVYLKNFKIRTYHEKTNILELLVLFYKTFKNKLLNKNEISTDNLALKVEKALVQLEIENVLFSKNNKFFEVEENINTLNAPIRYEKKLESLEKNSFQLKTFLNIQERKQKLPLLNDYKNLSDKSFLQETIDKILKSQDNYFSFNLRLKDIVKYFICNLYKIILKKLKDEKKRILNVKKYKSSKIKSFLDLLDYEKYELSNFDSLNELAPESSDGERITFKGAVNFLKISTLFSLEKKRQKMFHMGINFRDPEYNKLLYVKDPDISRLFDNIEVKQEISNSSSEDDLIHLLNLRFIREITFNLSFSEADSEFLTRAALFVVKENVCNFVQGYDSLLNINYITNLNKDSYFSLKLRYLIIKLIPPIIRKSIKMQFLDPIPQNTREIGCLKRSYNLLNTVKFDINNKKFLDSFEKNDKNNFLSFFYLTFEEILQDEEFFIALLKNQMYFECFNLLESKLAKIKDAEATVDSLESLSHAYDKHQTLLIKIYIYCYIKIEYLETGKIINLNLINSNVILDDIKSGTYDVKAGDLFYHYSEFFENFEYEKNGNLTPLYNLYVMCKSNFKNYINAEQEKLMQNKLTNEKSAFNKTSNNANNDSTNASIEEKFNSKISFGKFIFFMSEAVYHFSGLLSNIRSLHCRIENYKSKLNLDCEVNNSKNRFESATNKAKINKIKNNLESIKELEAEKEYENDLVNIHVDSASEKEFEEIKESIEYVIKYSEYFEKIIFSAFYLNKNLKRKITQTDSVFEFEEEVFSLIPEEENIFNISLNENLFYKFNSASSLFKEFIEENFIAFIFKEIAKKNLDEEANAQRLVNFTRFCHTQKFELNNAAKSELVLSTQKINSKKLSSNSSSNNNSSKIHSENLHQSQRSVNNLSNENVSENKSKRTNTRNHIEVASQSKKNLCKINSDNAMEIEFNRIRNANALNKTYSYNHVSLQNYNFEKLNVSTHEREYRENKSLAQLDHKIQLLFLGVLTNCDLDAASNSALNLNPKAGKNAQFDLGSKKTFEALNHDRAEFFLSDLNSNKQSEIKAVKGEDAFLLKVARCIMNATANLDYEIKILIRIIHNNIDERKNYDILLTDTKKLFKLFLKRYLIIEEIPENYYEFQNLLAAKKCEFEALHAPSNKTANKPANAKKSLNSVNNKNSNNNNNNNNKTIFQIPANTNKEAFSSKHKIISSEVYLEILEIFKALFSNYNESKDYSFFQKKVLKVHEELVKFFDDAVSQNIIKFRIIEINIKLNDYRDLDKYRKELAKIIERDIKWDSDNQDPSLFEKPNNDFLEAIKLLFELEFSKSEANCDGRFLDKSIVDSFIKLDSGTLLNLIKAIKKISIKDEYHLKSILSIFLNSFYTKSIQSPKESKEIFEQIEASLNPQLNPLFSEFIQKFILVKDSLLVFCSKLDPEKDKSFFVKFLIRILTEIIRIKPMESVFVFASLMETEKNLSNYKNSRLGAEKLKRIEKVLDFPSMLIPNYVFSMYSSKIISQIFRSVLDKSSNMNSLNNSLNIPLNQTSLLESQSNSNLISLLQKQKNLGSQPNNNSSLVFKTSIMNILEFAFGLREIKTLVDQFFEEYNKKKMTNNDRENLMHDFFEAESAKKDFKAKSIKVSIKDWVIKLNNFLKKEDVKIPMPNISNLKKPVNEMLFVRSMNFISPDDVFTSLEHPVKIKLSSQAVLDKNSGKSHKLEFIYIMKKSEDVFKEYKTAQIFMSIHDILNSAQSKIEKEISENFKCYEIIAMGQSIILIEFLQNCSPLRHKLKQVKSQYFMSYLANAEIELMHNGKREKEYIFQHYPRNLLQTCFQTSFPDAIEWYRMRKRFALSYAIWTMCAYIVKLGDRHLENIMINDFNQIIFIDYGYVMDDGSTLPVPEIVPVRFTNNLRYALGFLEESGVFFNTCFKVLRLIFKNSFMIFPQMKAIWDSIRENVQLKNVYDFDSDPNWMTHQILPKEVKKYLKNLETIVDFLKESKLKKDEEIEKSIRYCLSVSSDYARLEKMFPGWAPFV